MDTQLEVLSRQTDVYNESGTLLLYTIRPCPRSLIVARHPTSKRPYFTPWSKVLCQLCPQPYEIEMKDFQRHIAQRHLFDIRGEFMEAPDGSLRVTCKQSSEDFLYNIVKYKSYCSHTGKRLYVQNTELTEPTDKNCICLSCHKFYQANSIRRHIRKYGFDIIGLWKEVIDECGNHVLDSCLVSDPVRTPFVQKLCEVRDENVTNEDFITVYNENGQRVYSIEPKIKPEIGNCSNELLYTSTTMCTCYLCEANGNQVKRHAITHIQHHLLSEHLICLRNKYKREPGKIIFESTKRPTYLDNILDANRSIIYWDQKGIPVWWRIKRPIKLSQAHFCLRCEFKPTSRFHLFQHLKNGHKINVNNSDDYCYHNVIGDFIYYLDNQNAIHVGTSSSSTKQGAVKRPAMDPNANIVGASRSKYLNPQRTATHTLPPTAAGLTVSATTGSSQTSIGTASQPKLIVTSRNLAQSSDASATQGSSKTSISSYSNVLPQPVQRLPRRSETTTTSSVPSNIKPAAQQVPTLPVLHFWSSMNDIYDSETDAEILTLPSVTQPAQILAAPLETSPGTSSTQDIPTSSAMTSGQAALHPAPQGSVESLTPIETGPLKCIFCQQLIANCVCFGEQM